MYVDCSELSRRQIYRLMIQSIIPRPIAWVLSDNGKGSHNLAPFSYFNGIASDPPTIMISVGKKRDGSKKDTWVNIEARREFVVHITEVDLAKEVTETAASLAHGESELDRVRLKTTPFEGFRLPRVARAKVAFACQRHRIVEIGRGPQGVIFGEILKVFISDEIATRGQDELRIDPRKLAPLARLGGNDYSVLGEILTIERPA